MHVSMLGLAGTIIVIGAYLLQLVHLERERCSGGISQRAYALWFAASLLLFVRAVVVSDFVFVTLQSANAIATGMTLFLARRYRENICATHLHRVGSRQG